MSFYAIHHVSRRPMVSLAKFHSWFPGLRVVLAKRLILDGTVGPECRADLRLGDGMLDSQLYLVGPIAARIIIDAYREGRLPMQDGVGPGKINRAEVYAASPLFYPGNPDRAACGDDLRQLEAS